MHQSTDLGIEKGCPRQKSMDGTDGQKEGSDVTFLGSQHKGME